MREKKTKNVKKKRPLVKGVRWFLKLTQHISAGVFVLCMVALFLEGSVYVPNYEHRSYIHMNRGNDSRMLSSFFEQHLYSEVDDVLRFATIRSQLETDGAFALDREIPISDYYYRKNIQSFSDTGQRTYFPDAVYYLEDLIRWEQAGGLRYLGQNYNFAKEITSVNFADSVNLVDNMFLTTGNKRLEEIAVNANEYKQLCEQLRACMNALENNYREYQYYMKEFAEGKTSFIYFIYMDNEAGDVYTNRSELRNASKKQIEQYFDDLICGAAGTTSLKSMQGDLGYNMTDISDYMNQYDYAFGDNALVYMGIDVGEGLNDYYGALYQAILNYDKDAMYALSGVAAICGLYYLFVAIYLMYAAGYKVTKEGEEYIEVKWTDSVVTEVFIGWLMALGCAITIMMIELYDAYLRSPVNYITEVGAVTIACVTFITSILIVESLCSLARRYKAGTLLKNSLFYKIIIAQCIRLIKYVISKISSMQQKAQYYVNKSGLWEKTWGVLLLELVFYAVCIVMVFIFIESWYPGWAIVVSIVMLAVIFFVSYRRMRRKIERAHIIEKIEEIVAGEGSRVEESKLSLENAPLGRAVNEIGEGIRKAVETSTKDERLKAELLTNVSHDIKTPLTSIINYVDLLKKEEIESEKAKEYIEVLENKSLKLKNLIQDLIEVSKISTGNIEYEMMPINLHELIMQAAGEYEEKFEEHCLKVIYNNDAKDVLVLADPRRMWRVMENLLSNVYKYALEGTRVYIDIARKEDSIAFTIKNISAKELNIRPDELAERFVRGDVARTTEGSGLGLAIAENLIEGQGGRFDIMLDGDLFKVQFVFKIYKQ